MILVGNKYRLLLRLYTILRSQGLLGLVDESESKNVSELVLGEELRRIIDQVCCGTEPDILEEICFMRYAAAGYRGMEGMLYLLYFAVCLDIQAQVSARIIEERIKALLPDRIR